jgi:uncharacterized surface protein with fasciclin (FAS1) repeats
MKTSSGTVLERKNIVDTLSANGSFNILIKVLRATGIITWLSNEDLIFTLFAPNEKAFKKLSPWGTLKDLLDDKTLLTKVIHYHIVPHKIDTRHIDGKKIIRTLAGQNIILDTNSGLTVNNASIIKNDIICNNGLIQEIDAVLMPK